MSEELVQEGFTEDEALQAIEEKLEEREFIDELSAEAPEEPATDDADTPEDNYPQVQEAPIAAQEIGNAYARLQHDAHTLAAAMSQIETLRHTNPAEYAVAMQDVAAAQKDLARREQQLNQACQRVASENLAKEKKKLLNAIPDWKNAETAEREKAELRDFLRKRGYTDAEISMATARDIITAREAMLNSRTKAKAKTIPLKKPAGSNRIPGLDPVKQKFMERNVKHGTDDDIELRLIRAGYA